MSNLRLATEPYRNLAPATDTPERFQAVLDRRKDGFLEIPIHQRDAGAWTEEKQQKYVERLQQSQTGSHPAGSFVTYQIIGENGPSLTYLNDGYQRLVTLLDLEVEPSKYGMDSEGVRQLLQQQISVQHRHYDSHQAAMRDFQLINNGVRLSAWELCVGYLKYMDGYDRKWKPLLDGVEKAVAESSVHLTTGRTLKREKAHKLRRQTWGLFYRFLTEDKSLTHYQDVSATDVQPYVDRGTAIEQRLVVALEQHKDAKQVGRLFSSFIAQETATIAHLLRKTLSDGTALTPVLHRWLLDLAVWRRYNKKSREDHAKFVQVLLERTGGNSLWPRDDVRSSITINQLGHLPALAELAGMPEFCVARRRARKKRNLKNGYDESHLLPFVSNGDGPTVPEPAPLNRARGAQPMEDES